MGEGEFYRRPRTSAAPPRSIWSWRCRREDGSVVSTTQTFRYFLDCVTHARLHGYSNGLMLTTRDAGCRPAARIHAARPARACATSLSKNPGPEPTRARA
jgi:hypothetical protein